MFQLSMQQSAARQPELERQGLAARTKAIQQGKGSRDALEYLLGQLGTELSSERNEDYFAEALSFHLGLLEAHLGRPEAMAEHVRLSHTMPCAELDILFSDHVAQSMATREHQEHAMARGLPAILFACMPRSGSATLTHTLAKLLDFPVLHISAGAFPDDYLVPSWLDMFLEGGAITQDHFKLNDFNRGVLNGRGRREIFVTIRDPRAAARSQVRWLMRGNRCDSAAVEEQIRLECTNNFIPWLQSWIDVSLDPASPLRAHLIRFEDIARDLPGTVRQTLRTLQESFPAIAPFAEQEIEEVRIHFNSGDDEAWRSEVGERTRAALWDACSREIRHLLRLSP